MHTLPEGSGRGDYKRNETENGGPECPGAHESARFSRTRVVKNGVSGRNTFPGSGVNQRAGFANVFRFTGICYDILFSTGASYRIAAQRIAQRDYSSRTVHVEFIGRRNSSTILSLVSRDA